MENIKEYYWYFFSTGHQKWMLRRIERGTYLGYKEAAMNSSDNTDLFFTITYKK